MTIFDDNFWCQFWWQFWWLFLMTSFDDNFWMTIFFGTYFQLVTCDIWDTDYNTDNWEPGFITIFVTWQLIVTLDSIRNSCDVFIHLFINTTYKNTSQSWAVNKVKTKRLKRTFSSSKCGTVFLAMVGDRNCQYHGFFPYKIQCHQIPQPPQLRLSVTTKSTR